jgi:hypothetical protein
MARAARGRHADAAVELIDLALHGSREIAQSHCIRPSHSKLACKRVAFSDESLADRPLRAVRIAVFQITVFRGTVIICGLGTTDRPLRAVRIDVTTPVRPADGRCVHIHRGEHQRTERDRQRDHTSRKIFHSFHSICA